MAFRDDLEASHARAEALERRVADLEAENRELRGESVAIEIEAEPPPIELGRPRATLPLLAALAATGVAAAVVLIGQPIVGFVVGAVAVQLAITALVLSQVLYIAGPGVAAVISGRKYTGAAGQARGFRVVIQRRFVVIPILESVEALDLRPRTVEPSITNAYVKDNVPVAATFRARIHVADAEPLIGRAVERFLGRDTAEIDRVAVETLEGTIRGVFARLTLDEIRGDAEKLADEVIAEADPDLARLGLILDDLELVSVEPS
jgi:uncharacterized membrane protein YqiK